MELFIAWCGFLGAWLLVAGPLYQAALELRAEDIETERIRAAKHNIATPPSVSMWWWLLPPVKIMLEKRRGNRYRKAYLRALSPDDASALVSFISKATAWLFVSMGGLLLAVKETHELIAVTHFPELVFWIAVVVMPVLAIGNVIFQVSRGKRMLAYTDQRQ